VSSITFLGHINLASQAVRVLSWALIAYWDRQFKTSEVCLVFYIDAVCCKSEMSPYRFVCDVCSVKLLVPCDFCAPAARARLPPAEAGSSFLAYPCNHSITQKSGTG